MPLVSFMIRNIMLGGIFLSISFFLVKILSLFYVPILSRFLGPEGMGTLNLATLITPWITSLSSFSLSFVVTQFIAEHQKQFPAKTIVETSLLIGVFFGGLATMGYFLLAPWIAHHSFHDDSLTFYLRLGSPIILLSVLYTVAQGTLRGFKDFKRLASYEFCKQLINVLAGILLLLIGYRVGGAVTAMVFSTALIVFFFILRYLRKGRLSFSFSLAKKMLAYGGELTLLSFLLTLISGLDRYFLGINADKATVGFYAVAASVITASNFFPNSLRSSTFPYIAQYYAEGKLALAKKNLEQSVRYLLVIIGAFLIGLVTFRYEIIAVLFGASFLPSVSLITVLAYSLPFYSLYLIFHVVVAATGQLRLALGSLLAISAGLIALYAHFVPLYGAFGAAFIFVFTYVVVSFCYGYLLWKRIPVHFGSALAILVVQMGLASLALFISGAIFTKIILGALIGVAYLGILLACNLLSIDEILKGIATVRIKTMELLKRKR